MSRVSLERIVVFKINLWVFMTYKHVSSLQLARDIGLRQSAVIAWLSGARYPRKRSIALLASYFETSVRSLTSKDGAIVTLGEGAIIESLRFQDRNKPIIFEECENLSDAERALISKYRSNRNMKV